MTFLVRLLEAEAEAGQSSDGTVRAALLPRAPLMVRKPKNPHCCYLKMHEEHATLGLQKRGSCDVARCGTATWHPCRLLPMKVLPLSIRLCFADTLGNRSCVLQTC